MLTSLPLALSILALAPIEDKVMLTRTFEKDAKDTYHFDGTFSHGDQKMTISADFTVTITKVNDDGGADFEVKFTKLEGPGDVDPKALSDVYKDTFDKCGMPTGIEPKDQLVVLMIWSSVQYTPHDLVEVAKPFKIQWESKADVTMVGDGTLEKASPSDPTKKVSYALSITPKGEEVGKLTAKSVLDAKTGKLLSSVGDLLIGNGSAKFKITRKS